MEIKGLNGVIGAYKAQKPIKAANKEKTAAVRTTANLDRIEFDFSRSLEAAKTNIATEIGADATIQSIEKAREQLSSGELNKTSDELAAIIASF